ncbi:MAG: hypothetical protein CMO81_00990 [Waddliaceae bacterium]|nr:hypothetical protein [Waddliaceae bacterium]
MIEQVYDNATAYFAEHKNLPEIKEYLSKVAEVAKIYFSFMDDLKLEWDLLEDLYEEGLIDYNKWNFSRDLGDKIRTTNFGKEHSIEMSLKVEGDKSVDFNELDLFLNKMSGAAVLARIFEQENKGIEIDVSLNDEQDPIFIMENDG